MTDNIKQLTNMEDLEIHYYSDWLDMVYASVARAINAAYGRRVVAVRDTKNAIIWRMLAADRNIWEHCHIPKPVFSQLLLKNKDGFAIPEDKDGTINALPFPMYNENENGEVDPCHTDDRERDLWRPYRFPPTQSGKSVSVVQWETLRENNLDPKVGQAFLDTLDKLE